MRIYRGSERPGGAGKERALHPERRRSRPASGKPGQAGIQRPGQAIDFGIHQGPEIPRPDVQRTGRTGELSVPLGYSAARLCAVERHRIECGAGADRAQHRRSHRRVRVDELVAQQSLDGRRRLQRSGPVQFQPDRFQFVRQCAQSRADRGQAEEPAIAGMAAKHPGRDQLEATCRERAPRTWQSSETERRGGRSGVREILLGLSRGDQSCRSQPPHRGAHVRAVQYQHRSADGREQRGLCRLQRHPAQRLCDHRSRRHPHQQAIAGRGAPDQGDGRRGGDAGCGQMVVAAFRRMAL